MNKKGTKNKDVEEPREIDFSSYSPGSNAATCTSYQRSISGEAQSTQHQEEIGTILCAECWCCLNSLLGYWAQSSTGRHSDTVYQQAGTHFADLGRMTGRVNPTWY